MERPNNLILCNNVQKLDDGIATKEIILQGAAIVLAPLLLHSFVIEGVPILLPHPAQWGGYVVLTRP